MVSLLARIISVAADRVTPARRPCLRLASPRWCPLGGETPTLRTNLEDKPVKVALTCLIRDRPWDFCCLLRG